MPKRNDWWPRFIEDLVTNAIVTIILEALAALMGILGAVIVYVVWLLQKAYFPDLIEQLNKAKEELEESIIHRLREIPEIIIRSIRTLRGIIRKMLATLQGKIGRFLDKAKNNLRKP